MLSNPYPIPENDLNPEASLALALSYANPIQSNPIHAITFSTYPISPFHHKSHYDPSKKVEKKKHKKH